MKLFLLSLISTLIFSQTLNAGDLRDDIFALDGVIVRVWRGDHAGGHHVGHVSLETRNCYISLWPAGELLKQNILEKTLHAVARTHSRFNTFFYDIKDESLDGGKRARYPEQTIPILFVDWAKVEKKFDAYCKLQNEEKLRWTLAGDRFQMKRDEEGKVRHSCASIVYELLLLSGISKHLPLNLSYDPLVPVTPDFVAELAAWAGAYSFLDTKDLSGQKKLWHKCLDEALAKRARLSVLPPKISTVIDAISVVTSDLNSFLLENVTVPVLKAPNSDEQIDTTLRKITLREYLNKKTDVSCLQAYIRTKKPKPESVFIIDKADLAQFEFLFTTTGEQNIHNLNPAALTPVLSKRTQEEIEGHPLYKLRLSEGSWNSWLDRGSWYRYFSKPKNICALKVGVGVSACVVTGIYHKKLLQRLPFNLDELPFLQQIIKLTGGQQC